MAHLTLAGVSDDGKRLLLVDEDGAEHTVEIDARLRTAVHGETRRLENKMDSALRPRDIQARIRAGETPEAVAQAAQTSVDKIMAFAAPVLAERQHIAERAQRSSVRRSEGSAPHAARTLGEAVTAHLRSLNVDPDTVEWDAWRREDGRWSLTGGYASAERSGTAELTYDAPGNYVTLDNEDARWLVGESVAAAPLRDEPRDDLRRARERRRSALQDDELPLGDELSDELGAGPGGEPDDALGADAIDLVSEQPVEAFLDDQPPADPGVEEQTAEVREEAEKAAAEDDLHGHEPPTRRAVKKTRGRASVPSWDEIMFGGPSD